VAMLPRGGRHAGAPRLGAALYEVGRYREADRHLRYYTELAPRLGWAWLGYGCAAEALGLDGEARAAYRRAIELEDAGGPVTGGRAHLAELEEARGRRPRFLGRRDRKP
jgi:tetratricopeptide (TPR) repeat protein